jgi:transcriptional/translational regulatory protein YebC/TACO1
VSPGKRAMINKRRRDAAAAKRIPKTPEEIKEKAKQSKRDYMLTQNLHLAPSTQQAEQAGFTRAEITRRASQFSLKINKRQSS